MRNFYWILLSFLFISCGRKPTDPGIEYAPQMYHSIPLDPYSQMDYNKYYKDKKNAQAPVEGTVAVGKSDYYYPYKNDADGYELAGKELKNPYTVDEKFLAEGKRLFNLYCKHCHGEQGGNDGNVMASGKFPKPGWANYQSDYIRNLPEGKIFHTLTYGKNLMGSHATHLNPKERWMVVAHVKALSAIGAKEEVKADKADEKNEVKTDNKEVKSDKKEEVKQK